MLIIVETTLGVFLLLYFLIILYDVFSIELKKRETIIDEKKINILIELITKSKKTKDNKELKKINRKIIHKLSSLSYLSVLGTLLEKNIKIKSLSNKKIIDILNDGTFNNIFIKLASIYRKKDELSKAYYSYILKYVHPLSDEINNYLFYCLKSSSIYCKENALLAIYSIGSSSMVCEAYKIISRKNIYYNHRLISDSINNFAGNKKDLCDKLYMNFDSFNEEIKIGVLTFFRNYKYDIKEELFKRLEESNNEKEVEIAMIRYFTKVYYEKAQTLFIKRIEENYYNDFDYDIVMIQTLELIDNLPQKVKKLLIECLSNSNYYVRYNAAKVLNKKIDLTTIKNLKDPFAIDIVEYFISQNIKN